MTLRITNFCQKPLKITRGDDKIVVNPTEVINIASHSKIHIIGYEMHPIRHSQLIVNVYDSVPSEVLTHRYKHAILLIDAKTKTVYHGEPHNPVEQTAFDNWFIVVPWNIWLYILIIAIVVIIVCILSIFLIIGRSHNVIQG